MKAFAFALALAVAVLTTEAEACSRVREFTDGGRYVGGDLPTQIAARAHTIQLVRATRLELIGWTEPTPFFEAEAIFNIRFDVVETLAMRGGFLFWRPAAPGSFALEGQERTFSRPTPDGFRTVDRVEVWLSSEALDRPGSSDGFRALFAPVPLPAVSSCDNPIRVAPGEWFIVLRDRAGALYDFSRYDGDEREGLPINFNFDADDSSPARGHDQAPPLLRVSDRRDPVYLRIRAALAENGRLRR